MAKVALYVGLGVLAVVAAPIAIGLAGVVAGTTTLGAVAAGAFGVFTGSAGIAAAIGAWGTVALYGAAALMSPSQSKVGTGAAGSQVQFQADPTAGIPLMLGRSATAGKIIHANTSGQADKNKSLYYLIALTGGVLGNFESLLANASACAFDPNGNCTAPAQYAGKMFIRTTPGAKPDPGAYFPAGVAAPPEWSSAHKLSGVSCVWWTLTYDTTAYPTGTPPPLWVIRGPAVYDPRSDSTYPGGNGSQRWNDVSTWSLSGQDNPFLQGLAWCIGRFDNGKLTHGIGAPIDAIDVAAFVEGANVADANAWKVGGEVLSSDKKWDVLTTILQAGGGEPIQLGGLISAFVRTPKVILANATGADTVGNISITGTKRRRDRLNQIIPSYRSEANAWQVVPAGAVTISEYIAADGGLRSKEATYSLVQDPTQVAQLAAYDILDAREYEPITVPLGPRWQGVKPGDCIQITEPEFGMGEGQPVIIETRQLDLTTGVVTLTCRSETTGKHDYALGRSPNPPPIPGLQPSNPAYVAAPDPGSWVAVGTTLQGADGSTVPAIVVTGAVNDPNVAGVIIEYQLELSAGVFGDWVSGEFPATTRRVELRAVISGATYHVQVRYRNVRDVEGHLVLDLGLVTVGTLISGGVTQIGGQTPQELIDQLNETTQLGQETAALAEQTSEQAAQTAQDLLFTNQNLHDKTTLPDGTDLETYTVNSVNTLTNNLGVAQGDANYAVTRVDAIGFLRTGGSTFELSQTTLYANDTQTWGQYTQSLQTSISGNTAAITTEQTTRANADSALSTRIDSVTASAGNNTAAIAAEQTARANADSALSQQINTVSTTVDGHTSSITNLQSSVNGLNSQWVLSVSSQGPGYAQVAGIKLAANPTVSSIAFVASQIGFTDGTTNVYPLAIVGGRVIATNFQADDIKAHTITTDKIVANNLTYSQRFAMGGQVFLPDPSSGEVAVIAATFACSGGRIAVDIWGNLTSNNGDPAEVILKFYIDGVLIDTFGEVVSGFNSHNSVSYTYLHMPAAGNHTYQINGTATDLGGGGIQISINKCFITLTDNKTQA